MTRQSSDSGFVRIVSTAIALALSIVMVSFSTAAAAPKCVSPAPISVDTTQGQSEKGELAVTEYSPDGKYQVTTCDASGKAKLSVLSEPFPLNDSVVYLPTVRSDWSKGGERVTLDYFSPQDPAFAAGMTNHVAGNPFDQTVAPGIPSKVATPSPKSLWVGVAKHNRRAKRNSVRISADTSCTDRSWNGWHRAHLSSRRANYYTKVSSYPAGGTTTDSIRGGAYAWNNTTNSCGNGDQNNITLARMGDTNATIGSSADGQSTVDFGNISPCGGGSSVLACAFTRGGTEFDIRFNSATSWSHSGAAGRYDVQSVAAHEMGHYMGLLHASSSSSFLTMYAYTATGQIRERDLGIGDILGMRAQYPPV